MDPITIAALIAMAAGTAMNIQANNRAKADAAAAAARAKQAMDAEMARQDERRKEAYASHEQTLRNATRESVDEQMAADEARLNDELYAAGDEDGTVMANPLAGVQALGAQETRTDAARQMSNATNQAKKRIAGLARLTAGDIGGVNRGIGLANAGNNIGMINAMQRTGLDTANTEYGLLADAWKRPDTTKGDILIGLGSMGMAAGGASAGKAAQGASSGSMYSAPSNISMGAQMNPNNYQWLGTSGGGYSLAKPYMM